MHDAIQHYLNQRPRGFLPATDPLKHLPASFAVWEEFAKELPKLMLADDFRAQVAKLPDFPVNELATIPQWQRAMVILSFIGHAYVYAQTVVDHLPASIAKPWWAVAEKLQRPAVLSYASYALHNWYRFDNERPIALGNIGLLQNFLGGVDEEWFILVHVDIEAKAPRILAAFHALKDAIVHDDMPLVIECARITANCLMQICDVLDRMPEYCDPYIYYNRVRPYIHGWKDNPALPNGLIYQGVSDQPIKLRGETGAQSSIIPMVDAVLGITHKQDSLSTYLHEMRDYMPVHHRAMLEEISQIKLRDYVLQRNNTELKEIYNQCVTAVARFRTTHLHYAATYINKQSQTSVANSTETGTGGTPFMHYLLKHRDEAASFVLN